MSKPNPFQVDEDQPSFFCVIMYILMAIGMIVVTWPLIVGIFLLGAP